jgi:hypothetical protein
VAYVTPDLVVFAGRERGSYTHDSEYESMAELSEIRSICTRFVRWYCGCLPGEEPRMM